LIISSSAFKH
ncbi:hypothetical protein Zm00014a_007715, partial [Zea mays]